MTLTRSGLASTVRRRTFGGGRRERRRQGRLVGQSLLGLRLEVPLDDGVARDRFLAGQTFGVSAFQEIEQGGKCSSAEGRLPCTTPGMYQAFSPPGCRCPGTGRRRDCCT